MAKGAVESPSARIRRSTCAMNSAHLHSSRCPANLLRTLRSFPASIAGGETLQELVGFFRRSRLGELAEDVIQPSAGDRILFVTDEETGEVQLASAAFS
jgi:hypothetical protein